MKNVKEKMKRENIQTESTGKINCELAGANSKLETRVRLVHFPSWFLTWRRQRCVKRQRSRRESIKEKADESMQVLFSLSAFFHSR